MILITILQVYKKKLRITPELFFVCTFPVEDMTETKQVNLIIYLIPDKIHYLDKYL